ncbi:MAG TPA: ferredoxin--NADP reductase [Burkholderiaceae bacterium]|nr:ferredoxin--NADP reductase [Burkholderiaceae bacterium]
MTAAPKFTAETLTSVRPWAPNLFSFTITRDPEFRFTAGQFARIGVERADPDNPKDPSGQKIVWRAYSVASPSHAAFLEFFSVVVPDGEFTSELARLRPGATIYLERTNYGFLTLDRFDPARDLWLLCTGTGLAPFLSILAETGSWNDFHNLVVVHSVRYPNELAYADAIRAMDREGRLHYVPVVTRRREPGTLGERVPALLESGALEAHVGLRIDAGASRVLICGNPDMITATRRLLATRGLAPSRRGKPGQLAVENYW